MERAAVDGKQNGSWSACVELFCGCLKQLSGAASFEEKGGIIFEELLDPLQERRRALAIVRVK